MRENTVARGNNFKALNKPITEYELQGGWQEVGARASPTGIVSGEYKTERKG
jgi:hypothetical protein